jgi:FixJ family two-component response regulator
MKAGAVEFLTKPVDEQKLLQAIQEAIERDRHTRQQHAELRDLRHRMSETERWAQMTAAESEKFADE